MLRTMQLGQHALFVALLAIGAVRAGDVVSVGGAVLLGGWYASGFAAVRRRPDSWRARVWLGGLVLGWLLLVLWSAEFAWVAFAIFFICVHVLPVVPAVAVVVVMTGAVVATQLAQDDGNVVARVLGPCIGAAVAVGMGLLYERLVAQDARRRALVAALVGARDDLIAAQDALVAAQREAGAEAERARLARDIHDTLAQGFSSIVLLSRAGLTGAEDPRAVLGRIERTAADNLDEARRVVHALAPLDLDGGVPLTGALARLIDRVTDPGAPVTGLTVDGTPRPTPTAYDVALLRLAQGALANARQHAQASRVQVTLTYADDAVRLDVVDDGVGFDRELVSAGRARSGYGLRAMQERLEELGGAVEVETAPGRGTAVAATLPLVAPAADTLGPAGQEQT
ncbi:sensor histidine kinase [Mumia zhuanghuii]|uniref:Oxygen sensor histidine kinase NreB n=1 Tax=Mumia zhuanghuii TaxID=2585211 RepID=A0A5Q6RRZ6_9ACTN|nr:sensor histidine kinase [Mumia zhuanghuii]